MLNLRSFLLCAFGLIIVAHAYGDEIKLGQLTIVKRSFILNLDDCKSSWKNNGERYFDQTGFSAMCTVTIPFKKYAYERLALADNLTINVPLRKRLLHVTLKAYTEGYTIGTLITDKDDVVGPYDLKMSFEDYRPYLETAIQKVTPNKTLSYFIEVVE